MRRHVTAIAAAGVLAATAAGLAGAGGAAAKKPIAYWHLTSTITCAQEKTCKALPAWMKSLSNPFDAVEFADGTTYYKATVIAVGRRGPHRCDATLFSKPFTGRCVVNDFGVGFIKKSSIPGPYKGPDFWVASETAHIGGDPKLIVNPFPPYPLDTANPATPGHYTTGQLIEPAPGVSLVQDVVRTAVR